MILIGEGMTVVVINEYNVMSRLNSVFGVVTDSPCVRFVAQIRLFLFTLCRMPL